MAQNNHIAVVFIMHKIQVTSLSKNRLILGGTVFIGGFLSPLLIPLVVASELGDAWKSLLSAILLVGLRAAGNFDVSFCCDIRC